ncbi:MAG TPA: DnaJ domain-containing protein, partial [Chitinophagaceae bacterium]
SLAEVKQAYRRLAHLHHPDKTSDAYSASYFTEIKEAYEVLTNPSKKELYLQQRWYDQSIGKKKTQAVITPVSILKETLELERYVARLDVHRMDKEGLFDYINALLNDATIEKLNSFNEQEVNAQVVHATVRSVKVLKAKQAAIIGERLMKLAGDETKIEIEKVVQQLRKKEKWENKELLVVLLITAAICLLIWLSLK